MIWDDEKCSWHYFCEVPGKVWLKRERDCGGRVYDMSLVLREIVGAGCGGGGWWCCWWWWLKVR